MPKKLVYDEFMPWPYVEAYGMVPAPKKKRAPRKRKGSYLPKFKKGSALIPRPPKYPPLPNHPKE